MTYTCTEIENMNMLTDGIYEASRDFIVKGVDDEDWYMEWDEFHKAHPTIAQWQYDAKQKEIQEM